MRILPTNGRVDAGPLERALELAEGAAAFASPNPTVGCVLVRGDVILGEGAHHYESRDHAEIVALKDAGARHHDVRGATAYVTLEPCCHHGRTGPCSDALIAAGITRCVVATVDPNPVVRGQGLGRLRAAGVEVTLLDPESPAAVTARRLNDAFAFSIQRNRPFVTLKAALSRDGKIAPPQHERLPGKPFWLTGPAAREDVAKLRHGSDVLLTGIGTVLADDPFLTDRTGLPRRRRLLRIVLDSSLRMPLHSHLVQSAQDDLLIVCDATADSARMDALRQRPLEVLPLDTFRKERLHAVMALLQQRGMRSVLVEAGTALNGALLDSDLADKLVLYFAPVELGPEGLPVAEGGSSLPDLQQRLRSQNLASFPHGDRQDWRESGYLHDPWADLQEPAQAESANSVARAPR